MPSAEISQQLACKGALGGLCIQKLGNMLLLSRWVLGGKDKKGTQVLTQGDHFSSRQQLELCYGRMSSLWLCLGTPAFCHIPGISSPA